MCPTDSPDGSERLPGQPEPADAAVPAVAEGPAAGESVAGEVAGGASDAGGAAATRTLDKPEPTDADTRVQRRAAASAAAPVGRALTGASGLTRHLRRLRPARGADGTGQAALPGLPDCR